MNYWPSVGLLLLISVVWLEFRILAGRTTLSLSQFSAFFTLGSIASVMLALLGQRFSLIWLDNTTTSWLTGPPIEELAKAAPALMFILVLLYGRRLSIADVTLMGLAAGLGFEFVETNLSVLKNGSLPAFDFPYFMQYSAESDGHYQIYNTGHGLGTALVCLFAIMALRLWPSTRGGAIAFAVPAFLCVTFDHCMWNWKLAHAETFFGTIANFPPAADWAERLYDVTLHGRITLLLLPAVLLLASWTEATLCWKASAKNQHLLLSNETRPRVLVEWLIALDRARFGPRALFDGLTFFRHRRAYTLVMLEGSRHPENEDLRKQAAELKRRVFQELPAVQDPVRSRWLPAFSEIRGGSEAFIKKFRWVLFGQIMVILFFMLGRKFLSIPTIQILFGKPMAVAMTALGVGLVTLRFRRFRHQSRPDVSELGGEALVKYHAQSLLMSASLGTTVIGALGTFLPHGMFLPAAAYITGHLRDWRETFTEPGPFICSLPIWGTAQPEPADPTNLKKDLDDLKKEFEDQQKQLREEVGNSLEKIAQTNETYNKEWNAGMQDLDDYRSTMRPLMKDLKDLWTAQGNRKWATDRAAASDIELQMLMMADGAIGMMVGGEAVAAGAKALTEEGLLGEEGAVAGSEGGGRGTFNPDDPVVQTFDPEEPRVHTFDPDRPPDFETQRLPTDELPSQAGDPPTERMGQDDISTSKTGGSDGPGRGAPNETEGMTGDGKPMSEVTPEERAVAEAKTEKRPAIRDADSEATPPSGEPPAASDGQEGERQTIFHTSEDGKYWDHATGKEVNADGSPIDQPPDAPGNEPPVDPKGATQDLSAAPGGKEGERQTIFHTSEDGKYWDHGTGKEVNADGSPIGQPSSAQPVGGHDGSTEAGALRNAQPVDPKGATQDLPAGGGKAGGSEGSTEGPMSPDRPQNVPSDPTVPLGRSGEPLQSKTTERMPGDPADPGTVKYGPADTPSPPKQAVGKPDPYAETTQRPRAGLAGDAPPDSPSGPSGPGDPSENPPPGGDRPADWETQKLSPGELPNQLTGHRDFPDPETIQFRIKMAQDPDTFRGVVGGQDAAQMQLKDGLDTLRNAVKNDPNFLDKIADPDTRAFLERQLRLYGTTDWKLPPRV